MEYHYFLEHAYPFLAHVLGDTESPAHEPLILLQWGATVLRGRLAAEWVHGDHVGPLCKQRQSCVTESRRDCHDLVHLGFGLMKQRRAWMPSMRTGRGKARRMAERRGGVGRREWKICGNCGRNAGESGKYAEIMR